MERFSIIVGDITLSGAEAIVNAANTTLLGGSGVDGAIHRPAVLHTPGPIWQGGGLGEPALLASCYRSCLALAEAHGIESVDFPSISTGVYGYPLPLAATVALRAIMDWLAEHDLPRQVRMVCHTEAAAAVYRQTWNLWYAEEKADRL